MRSNPRNHRTRSHRTRTRCRTRSRRNLGSRRTRRRLGSRRNHRIRGLAARRCQRRHAGSSLLHSAAAPSGRLTPAEAPLIDADFLFRQPGPVPQSGGTQHLHGGGFGCALLLRSLLHSWHGRILRKFRCERFNLTWQVCLCAYKCARVLKRPKRGADPGAADLEAEVYPWGRPFRRSAVFIQCFRPSGLIRAVPALGD